MKVLIIEQTFIPHPTEPELGPQLLAQGSTPDVDKDTARKLVDAQKALYTAKTDDPYKGQRTAEKELIDAAAKAMTERAKAEKVAAKASEATQ